MVVKLLTYYGEEVDIMLIFSPQIPHILSVNLKVSSTGFLPEYHFLIFFSHPATQPIVTQSRQLRQQQDRNVTQL